MPERMPTSHPAPPTKGDAAGALDASVNAMLGQLARSDADAADLAEFESLTPDAAPGGEHEIHAPGLPPAPSRAAEVPQPRIVVHHAEDDDLLRTVQELLAEALAEDYIPAGETARIVPPASARTPAPTEPAGRIETLDQELAGIADDLIETELAGDPEELEDHTPTLAGIPAPAPRAAEAEAAAPAATGPAAQELSAASSEASAEALEPIAPAAAPSTEAADLEAVPLPAQRSRRVVHIHLPALPGLDLLQKSLLLACAAISAPLRSKPQHIRDIVGWNALWLAFLGGCVWVYLLFFRSPEPPVPSLLPPNSAHVEPVSAKSKDAKSKDDAASKHTPVKKAAAAKSAGH